MDKEKDKLAEWLEEITVRLESIEQILKNQSGLAERARETIDELDRRIASAKYLLHGEGKSNEGKSESPNAERST